MQVDQEEKKQQPTFDDSEDEQEYKDQLKNWKSASFEWS
jgi:hypothetical protein